MLCIDCNIATHMSGLVQSRVKIIAKWNAHSNSEIRKVILFKGSKSRAALRKWPMGLS